ncbi:MFS transporter [Devosia psychrophila]|uniref:MFS transporter n=1 Tax=Devosia psychrophila TaxID=728005 RepID=A0A0F5PVP5_9HYPH|nr:MFS transporter [Devosia psychrophila]KKC31899.1 MFS transporter [Devosia psychrophila]SFD04374.1 Major Facilitator Superfamily protein [Devosia psychrophila]
MSDSVEGRWAEIFTPRYAPVTLILCLGVALLAFNAFLASISLPTAVREMGGVALISWALTLFLVFAIVGGSGAALLKQRLGARTALLVSAAVFLVGTVVAGSATSMEQVLVGRALQGLGEGVVSAICFALIPELFPSRLVPKVFGLQAMIWAIAAFGGPAVAGLLTELVSWRAAFLVNVPLVLIFAAMVMEKVPAHSPTDRAVVTFPGLRLLVIGAGIMLVAIAGVAQPLPATGLLMGAAALLVGAVWLDGRARDRLMPPDAFRPISVVGTGLWMVLLINVAGAGSAVYLVLVVQEMWGYGPTAAGALAAVLAVAWSLSAVTVANVRSKETRKLLIRLGPLMIGAGLLLVMAGLQLDQVAVVIVGQLIIGSGFGTCNGYLNLTMMEAASDGERDRTSALMPTTQSAGNAIGAALAGVAANAAGMAAAVSTDEVKLATVPVYVLGAVVAALALAAAWRMVGMIRPQDANSSFAAG